MTQHTRIITAKAIFNGESLLTNKAIKMVDGIVVEIMDTDKIKYKDLTEDYGNSVICSGFIDLQLNGCGGVLFNDSISLETLEKMHQTNLRFGTTGYLPTLITADFNDVRRALKVVKAWFESYGNTRGVLGLHLEGPFISREKRGIHPEHLIIEPTDQLLTEIVAYAKYYPIMLTIAPEKFSSKQIKYLSESGVIVSLGHSNASVEEAITAFENGASTVTHIFNAMSGLTGRNPGLIGATILTSSYMGLIVDLLHVDKANIKMLAKIKPDHTFLVTDAVTPTGTNMTEFDFAGKHLYVKEGKCVDENGTLGGAYLTMNEAIKNCVLSCEIKLETALRWATAVPASLLGLPEIVKLNKSSGTLIALDLASYSCTIV